MKRVIEKYHEHCVLTTEQAAVAVSLQHSQVETQSRYDSIRRRALGDDEVGRVGPRD